MPWINASDRLPDKTGEYQVKRLTAQGREVSDKCYYEKKGNLKIVIGQEKLEDTTALTQAALEG